MKISNKKGAILGIVLIYMLIMTILGYGLLHLSYANSIQTDNSFRSNRAFWAAETGITKATARLKADIPDTSNFSGIITADNYTDNYSVTIDPVDGYIHRWEVTSTGAAGTAPKSVQRTIKVTIGPNIANLVNIKDPLPDGETWIDIFPGGHYDPDRPTEDDMGFTFDSIFGIPLSSLTIDNLNPTEYTGLSGVTWVDVPEGETLFFQNPGEWSGSGLMIVNGDLRIVGGDFSGILWITGNLTMSSGNPGISGAIFATNLLGDITGNISELMYDPLAIDQVLDGINPNPPLGILSWEEVPSS